MKKTLLLLAITACAIPAIAQINIPYQTLTYNAHYHFGLINVEIAKGTVTVECNQNNFRATLNGESIPWEGHVFCVADTLYAEMTPSDQWSKERVTYKNGWYRKPTSQEFREGTFDFNNPANYKNILGQGSLDASPQTMEAITVTADMLGLYYFYHEIDFDSLKPGQEITIPITGEGGQPEKVVINYYGKTRFNNGGTDCPVYDLTFEYSYDGSMTGYPVKTYVSEYDRIPLFMSATLPVGRLEMIYAY